MTLQSRISAQFEESGQLKLALAELLANPIAHAAELIVEALLKERKVLACGNAGGAASAQYFTSLLLNRYDTERPGLAAMALCANVPALTAISHDIHPDMIYARQIFALGLEGDILLVICNDGNVDSLLTAISAASERGIRTIVICGGDGGKLMELIQENDIHIAIPQDHPARIQETCVLILHCLCDTIDCLLLGAN
jgi:D-sedoheptulose 7-phosphate isomerase